MLGLDVRVCSLSLCRKTHRAPLAEGMAAIKPASSGKAATSRNVGMVSLIGTKPACTRARAPKHPACMNLQIHAIRQCQIGVIVCVEEWKHIRKITVGRQGRELTFGPLAGGLGRRREEEAGLGLRVAREETRATPGVKTL